MQKRGLSNIVATVLIVLAALVAIGIVWAMISPVFERSGETIEAQEKCYGVSVEPQKCVVSYGGSGDEVNVTVQVSEGVADGLIAVVEYGDASFESEQLITDNVVETYETRLISISTSNPSGAYAVRARAAAIVKTSSGENVICEESSVTVMCGMVECQSDADCNDSESCINGICTFFSVRDCTKDSDCPSGKVCNSGGHCVSEGGPSGDGGDGEHPSCSTDGDGDGYIALSCGGDDCNDADPYERPGQDWLIDRDGDDYADSSGGVTQCSSPGGDYVPSELVVGLDCDDYNPEINPLGIETCGDHKDNDCDGVVDESGGVCDVLVCGADGVTACFAAGSSVLNYKQFALGTGCDLGEWCYIPAGPTCDYDGAGGLGIGVACCAGSGCSGTEVPEGIHDCLAVSGQLHLCCDTSCA